MVAQKAKKEYQINSNLSMRLTEKSGVNDEVIDFLNEIESGKTGQEVIKAIKYWIRTQDANDRIRRNIEDEAMKMEVKLARYGLNRGPYKKHGQDEQEEIVRLKEQLALLQEEKKAQEPKPSPAPPLTKPEIVAKPPEPSEEIVSEIISESDHQESTSYEDSFEDELYGNGILEEKIDNPMLRALKSIPKRG